jgi:undecaprenyl-diphosphatase
MAWSRVATAHHYPSDVIAGVALAVALSFPLSSYALAFF